MQGLHPSLMRRQEIDELSAHLPFLGSFFTQRVHPFRILVEKFIHVDIVFDSDDFLGVDLVDKRLEPTEHVIEIVLLPRELRLIARRIIAANSCLSPENRKTKTDHQKNDFF
jgi:hypothetical protein